MCNEFLSRCHLIGLSSFGCFLVDSDSHAVQYPDRFLFFLVPSTSHLCEFLLLLSFTLLLGFSLFHKQGHLISTYSLCQTCFLLLISVASFVSQLFLILISDVDPLSPFEPCLILVVPDSIVASTQYYHFEDSAHDLRHDEVH